jgi:hypothetical protein
MRRHRAAASACDLMVKAASTDDVLALAKVLEGTTHLTAMDSAQRCRDQASECLQLANVTQSEREAATLRASPLAGQDLLVRSADTPRSYVNRALKFERPPQLAAGPVQVPKETTPVSDNRGRYLVRAIGRPTIKARPNKSLRPSNLGISFAHLPGPGGFQGSRA